MTARPLAAITAVLGPIPQLLIVIGNAITPGRGFREGPFATEAELRELVDLAEQSRVIESDESRMIHSVFELGDTMVREVMVPRTDMVFIERYKTLRQMMSLALRSGFSRIPVIGEDLDDVIGIAYLKDVTKRVFDRHEAETTERIETVMRPCIFVPDSKPADELMREMQAKRTHVAIVVDEYGGTAGLVTIEDLLEEIVGEITDEYDVEPDAVERLVRRCGAGQLADAGRRAGRAVRRRARRRGRRDRRRPDGQAPRQGADPRRRGDLRGPALQGRVARRTPQQGRHRGRQPAGLDADAERPTRAPSTPDDERDRDAERSRGDVRRADHAGHLGSAAWPWS